MSNYLGYKCVVCGQKFDEKDDIVVCPDCGTPYHRECYMKSGKCVNEELHKTGESWEGQKEHEDEKSEYKKCPYCGTVNKPHTIICEHCGAPLVDEINKNMASGNAEGNFGGMNGASGNGGMYGNTFAFNPQDKYCGMNPDEDFESVSLKELSDFVKTNQIYYLPIFKKMKDTGQKISINVTSFLFPQLYFANRKMWIWTAVSILVSLVLSVPSLLYMMFEYNISGSIFDFINIESKGFEIIYNASGFLSFVFKALMLMFSNWFYYRFSLKKIKRSKMADGVGSSERLSAEGGTNTAAIFIAFAAESALTLLLWFIFTK